MMPQMFGVSGCSGVIEGIFCPVPAAEAVVGVTRGRVALQSDRLRNAQTIIDFSSGDECRRGRTGVRSSLPDCEDADGTPFTVFPATARLLAQA